jgi:hypothetical protein
MIQDELSQEIIALTTEITREAVGYFQRALDRGNLVLTADLKSSFEYHITYQAGQLAAAGEIHFGAYGRFKDMKRLNYVGMPPIDQLETYIEKVGLDKFAWVNRFGHRKVPTTRSDARHIAWAIAMHRKKVNNVGRRPNQRWYNRTKADFVNVMRRRMLDRAQSLVAKALKEQAEGK